MSRRDFSEKDIHLALDGELPADDRAALEAWLEAHPDMKARSQRFAADRDRLRAALADVASEPVPRRLRQALEAKPQRARDGGAAWLAHAAAAAAIFALGAAAGYGVALHQRPQTVAQDRVLADSAIHAHDVYAAEKLHVVEVKADQRDHLVGWLSKRVGLQLVAPDLSGQGYELMGGRLLPQNGKTAAQFMYENRSGDRVSLYVTREQNAADTGFRSVVEGGTRALYWMDEDYGCAIAGSAPEPALMSMADTAYRQLLAAEKR